MIEKIKDKRIIYILIFLVPLISFYVGVEYQKGRSAEEIDLLYSDLEEESENLSAGNIKVHIHGAVEKPGLYELEEGMRLDDLLNKAQPREDAIIDRVLNRAKILEDEESIYVHTIKELEEKETLEEGETDGSLDFLDNNPNEPSTGGKINLNKATSAELQSLTGIGPVKAEAIIDYRERVGSFKNIEEITNVKGIGPATFEKIKERISC